jgi:hypothetical protein
MPHVCIMFYSAILRDITTACCKTICFWFLEFFDQYDKTEWLWLFLYKYKLRFIVQQCQLLHVCWLQIVWHPFIRFTKHDSHVVMIASTIQDDIRPYLALVLKNIFVWNLQNIILIDVWILSQRQTCKYSEH